MSRKRDVGMKIRAAREACGLSQQALADAIGAKSHQNVYNYERGDREPSFEVLERIAAATGKPLAWFFQDEDAPPVPAENPTPQPDMQSLLAQLVAAQVQMLQAQARAEERQAEMSQALTAMAHEQMQARAEAARTQRRLQQVESDLRETDEGEFSDCGEGEETRAG